MSTRSLKKFIQLESSAGILLVMATLVALIVSNSALSSLYDGLLNTPLAISLGTFSINKPILLWINDGLMAIFFLLVGLEVKREILQGQLSSKDQLILPAVAALSGFVIPALFYVAINSGHPESINGWAIPAATDIAFALGILMLLGKRVPLALKVFLTSVAIFDDIAAIVVIAMFYSDDLSVLSLLLGGFGITLLMLLNRLGIKSLTPFILVGIVVWVCVLKSGVHATLAGFILGLTIPMGTHATSGSALHQGSPLRYLEHALHPWIAYAILPIFAFANAGVSFKGVDSSIVFSPVSIGIAAGLFLGKQLGVFAALWLMIKFRFARMPKDTTWLSMYGVSLLTGVGFTMSLFIGSLAFEHGNFEHMVSTRVGVFIGSFASAVAGFLVLKYALNHMPDTSIKTQPLPVSTAAS